MTGAVPTTHFLHKRSCCIRRSSTLERKLSSGFGSKSIGKWHMLMRGIVGMHMPLTSVAVNPEDALPPFDECEIERTGQLTKQNVNKEILPNAEPQ
ncbi:MAG: hypothetical protein V2B19_17650 [Pseudomonadota bacterium]